MWWAVEEKREVDEEKEEEWGWSGRMSGRIRVEEEEEKCLTLRTQTSHNVMKLGSAHHVGSGWWEGVQLCGDSL